MFHTDPSRSPTLGADLRALRRSRRLTLADMAEHLGKSVGWMSQVERDLSAPGLDDLRRIASRLDVPVSLLFGQAETPAAEAGHIVRKGARRLIGTRQAGLTEELLSPDLTDDFEMIHSTFEPDATSGDPVTRPTQEVGYIVSGQLTLWIDEVRHDLGVGDSFRIRNAPFRWANPHEHPAVVIWVIAPPVY